MTTQVRAVTVSHVLSLPGLMVDDHCGGEDGGWQSHGSADGPDEDQGDHHRQLAGLGC